MGLMRQTQTYHRSILFLPQVSNVGDYSVINKATILRIISDLSTIKLQLKLSYFACLLKRFFFAECRENNKVNDAKGSFFCIHVVHVHSSFFLKYFTLRFCYNVFCVLYTRWLFDLHRDAWDYLLQSDGWILLNEWCVAMPWMMKR